MVKIILAWFDAIKMELEMTYEEQDVMEILRKRVTLINFWLVMKALTNETFMFENKEWLWIDDLEVKTGEYWLSTGARGMLQSYTQSRV